MLFVLWDWIHLFLLGKFELPFCDITTDLVMGSNPIVT
jgi:hypothetical protein